MALATLPVRRRTISFLDLFDDGQGWGLATLAECEAACRAHALCQFFEANPARTVSWCKGYASCDAMCDVEWGQAQTVYSIYAGNWW